MARALRIAKVRAEWFDCGMFNPTDRGQFLNLAGLMEGSLLALAFLLGWFAGINPLENLHWDLAAVGWGLAGAAPLFLIFLVTHRFPIGPLARIKQFLVEVLGPSLAVCRWYDLVLLAILAGVCEEAFFRGLLQPWIGRFGFWTGLIGSNVVFGLAHMVTPTYAVLAGVVGVYLGLLLHGPEESNLAVPIITHGVYDYLAFLVVVRTYRSQQVSASSESADGEDFDAR